MGGSIFVLSNLGTTELSHQPNLDLELKMKMLIKVLMMDWDTWKWDLLLWKKMIRTLQAPSRNLNICLLFMILMKLKIYKVITEAMLDSLKLWEVIMFWKLNLNQQTKLQILYLIMPVTHLSTLNNTSQTKKPQV